MNFPLRFLAVSLFALVVVDTATAAGRGKLDLIAIGERTAAARELPTASAADPLSYVAVQGRYIEAGDPVAGERPPQPEAVVEALRAALSTQDYTPAAAGVTPQLVVTYHWGVIRPDSTQLPSTSELKPNLKTRLSLVARQKLVEDIERDLIAHRYTRSPVVSNLIPSYRDALEWAHDSRYFVIVSAYRYESLIDGSPVLVWRTRLSAADNSGSMSEVIPALLAAAGDQLGQEHRLAELLRVPFPSVATSSAPDQAVDRHVEQLNRDALQQLLHDERLAFSGKRAWELASAR